jgi:hypothetical protein
MWVAELACEAGHRFEGWFASRDDFESQRGRGLVSCPTCGSGAVERCLSAPRLNLGAAPAATAAAAPAPPAPPAVQLRQLLQMMRDGSEDLGHRFPEEARRIHAGDAPERAIRGQASGAELEALLDEGIAVLPLPDPEAIVPTH